MSILENNVDEKESNISNSVNTNKNVTKRKKRVGIVIAFSIICALVAYIQYRGSYLEFFEMIWIACRVAIASPERGGGCAEGADGGVPTSDNDWHCSTKKVYFWQIWHLTWSGKCRIILYKPI